MAGTANSTFVFPGPRPGSPTKEDLKPNAHPYPIRTTSTGVLSRSNSITSRSGNQHSYVPSSPNPTISPPKKMNGSGHRYNRSLSNDGPRPLPIPPPSPSAASSNNSVHSLTESPTRHSSPLPTPPGASPSPSLSVLDGLPVSPKSWTPSQLALYLATTLRARSGETFQLPAPVAQDIANFVRESKITGRSFLRMKEEDLEQFEINKLWRTALLSASRSLRQSVLKGRIWGFGNTSLEDPLASPLTASSSEDSDSYAVRDDFATMRSRPASVRGNPFADEVAAPLMEGFSENSTPRRQARVGRYRNGRVQGMVEHLERSGSESSPTRHERSNSVSSNGSFYDTAADGDAYETVKQQQRDSVSSTGSDTFDTVKDGKNRPLPPPPSDGNDSDQLSMDELLKRAGIMPRDAEKFVNSRRKASKKVMAPQDLGDTSMEELDQAWISAQEGSKSIRKRKATTGRSKKSGVHAWEEDGSQRVTMRRALPMPIPAADIFASQAMYAAEETGPAEGPVPPVEPMLLSEPMDAVKLELELEETRAMVRALKRRIESVESKVANMEAAERFAPAPAPAPVFPPGSIIGRLLGRILGEERKDALEKYYARFVEPTSVRGIPSYVLLMGFGVCAVVLRVIVKKGLLRRKWV
ncbi:hypothetical protein CYLTODRAFT_381226 [Cylindrobasidium torrendii FP15055 ss-10]|uniref:Uncharacterized protein n=1 Tax=Cylindrobasidium torrendii FP15055 ss-10 TaxID=1314674 RepID=A0A0D7B1U0_9AGAR|nr:hypothetical protein CYLTODRAFT_381226 [Cylindrobasidium torrendii FP15055 ss-10]